MLPGSLGVVLRRAGIGLTLLLALGIAPALSSAPASASSLDVASTHAYLVAGYSALHATVTKWSAVEASIHRLDRTFAARCPHVGEGSPQNEPAQKLSYEVAGALWAVGYHVDAKIVARFSRAVSRLRWSDPRITRSLHRYVKGLKEMVALHVPDLCGDVSAWKATGFATIPQSTLSYDRHVEAIQVKEIPHQLLRPYLTSADRALASSDERLSTRFQNLETVHGFNDWDTLLETLSLNQ